MCAGAAVLARLDRVVFGAADPKAGFAGSLGNLVQDPRLNHRTELTSGVLAEESAERAARVLPWPPLSRLPAETLADRGLDAVAHGRQLPAHRAEVARVHHDGAHR